MESSDLSKAALSSATRFFLSSSNQALQETQTYDLKESVDCLVSEQDKKEKKNKYLLASQITFSQVLVLGFTYLQQD